jgi:phenylacetate-CoA ligase
MKLDFSSLRLAPDAFSETPMTFCDSEHKRALSSIMDILLVETGSREARENWQAAQLRNLLAHAAQKSSFWRQRIGPRKNYADITLSSLPILTRAELREQVAREGSLLPAGGPEPVEKHATSGSSGTPVEFFVSRMNGHYNRLRGLAQHFIDDRDLSLNMTRLRSRIIDDKRGFTVSKAVAEHGLRGLVAKATYKEIKFTHPDFKSFCKELRRDPVGHLIAQPHIVEALLQHAGVAFFKAAGVATWIAFGDRPPSSIRSAFSGIGIPISARYSSEEIGLIAHECRATPDFYHVCTSNVLVEIDECEPIDINGKMAGRVLLTHLHSYATPFIRYDIGDIASLHTSCPCGYQGPVLSNIYGRTKQLLKYPDGRLSPFFIRGADVLATADISEYRIRQTELQTIVVELAAPEPLPAAKIDAFRELVRAYAGEGFDIEVRQVSEIDWGADTKRLGFRNELLA